MESRHVFRPRKATMVLGVLLLLVLSIGIGVTSAQDGDQAQLRVVHAAPDAGDVDIYVDGELAIEGLAYTDATEFQALEAGDYQVQVTAAGGDVAEAVIDTSLTLEGGDMITAVAHGTADGVDVFTVNHDWDDPAEGQARIVVVNATSDESEVEVRHGEDEAIGDGAVSFGSTTNAEVEPGDYDFQIVVGDETVTTVDGFAVEADTTYSIFVMGSEGSFEAVPYEDMAAAAPGGDTTPETDATPDADTTPEADETPEADTTPDADATPDADTTPDADATPDADTTPDADATPDADTTPDTDATPDADMTPDTATTPTTEAGTGGGDPSLPETGAGGTAGGDSTSGWIALAIAGLAVALGGGLIWRTRNERTAA